jgi:hypothetical protein
MGSALSKETTEYPSYVCYYEKAFIDGNAIPQAGVFVGEYGGC